QIAGGKSPRLSLGELTDLGVDVAIYSTPCLFAAHKAMDTALAELRLADGRLPAADGSDEVGVGESTRLLAKNLTRHHPVPGVRESVSV
ncbi:carboxyvinyl-carboxyphosphonate phosphorylmutase, partial [Streptomyces subrutilus]